jgi:DNA anti-recombination protein RmuC
MLTVVLKQIQNYKVEESIKNVFKNVEKLSSHLNAYKVYHEKLGNQLGITVGHYNTSTKEFKKIDKDVIKITSGNSKIEIESEIVEKPKIEN